MKASIKMEAMRLAKNIVKDVIKRKGISIINVKASDITKAAKVILELIPTLYDEAKSNLDNAVSPHAW